MNLRMVYGMFIWCSLCVSVCMLIVLNALLMSSANVIVHSGGLFNNNNENCLKSNIQ